LKDAGIFISSDETVAKLEAARPASHHRAYAFLQVTTRGHGFQPFDNASPSKSIVLTGESYLALLSFFKTQYDRVCSKLRDDMRAMSSCGVRISENLMFFGSGVSRFQQVLENFGDFGLCVIVSLERGAASGGDEIVTVLKYKLFPNTVSSDANKLGHIQLPADAFQILSKTATELEVALNHHWTKPQFGEMRPESVLPHATAASENLLLEDLALQIRNPVPRAELNLGKNLTAKTAGFGANPRPLTLAAPFCKPPRGEGKSAVGSSKKREALKNLTPSLNALLNKGPSTVSAGDRDTGYHTEGGAHSTGTSSSRGGESSGETRKRPLPGGNAKNSKRQNC
jgi:hypothetical protein